MWALSEMLDNAKEAIFIMVRIPSKVWYVGITHDLCRIGGLLPNYTSADLLPIILPGGLIEFCRERLKRGSKFILSCTKRLLKLCP